MHCEKGRPVTFLDWWESDRRFEMAHEDEATQCRATWNEALTQAAEIAQKAGQPGIASLIRARADVMPRGNGT